MTDPDPNFDPPAPPGPPDAARPDGRRGWHTVSPFVWFLGGVCILLLLSMAWLMPISRDMKPLTWLGDMLGFGGGFFETLLDPRRLSLIVPGVLVLLILTALSRSLAVYRRRTAAAVLGHVATAVELRVPLPPYLRAAAQGERPTMKRRLIILARDLAVGRSVGASLADAAGELPELTIDRIAAAEKSFALDDALAGQLLRERARMATVPVGGGLSYFAVLIVTVVSIVWLVMIFVIPKFAQIFADFHLKLPAATQLLIDLARMLGGNVDPRFMVVVPQLLLLAVCVMLASAARGLFTSRPRRGWLRPVMDHAKWYAPLLGRLTRDRHSAAACAATAEAIKSGRTLPEAIALATMPGLNAVLKRRMRQWRQTVEAGVPAATAARESGLPRLWCDLMAGAATGPAAAADFAGRAYSASHDRRVAVAEAVLPVLLTLLMAGVVGFVAVALFSPLLSLIDSIAITKGFHR